MVRSQQWLQHGQRIGGGEALGGVGVGHAPHTVPQRRGVARRQGAVVLAAHVPRVLRVKGRVAQHVVRNQPHREHVRLAVVQRGIATGPAKGSLQGGEKQYSAP